MSKTIFTNGVFDILTIAHFNLFLKCAELAGPDGHIVVALDSDKKVRQDKGSDRPFFTESERVINITMLKLPVASISTVTFDTNEQLHGLIKATKPNFIVKSEQWKNNVVGSDLAEVIYFPVFDRFSTTKIAERVILKYNQTNKVDPFDRIDDK